nr:hypothetical protein [Tanacetum cinerariifolium]
GRIGRAGNVGYTSILCDIIKEMDRMPRSGIESEQWGHILDSLEGVMLNPSEDRWSWDLNGSEEFLVASTRSHSKTLLDVNFLWKKERVRLLVGSPGASTTLIYSLGSSSTPIYSPGSSTPPRYSPGASTPQIYSLGTSRNVEFSNCKHLLDKITVLEATVDMYMHLEQHTVNSAELFHVHTHYRSYLRE